MKIGFALNEVLALLALATGLLSLAWWRLRRRGRRDKPWWVHWGADFFAVIALIFGCRVALADWQRVPTGSMEPNLRVGDLLLINHLAYGPRLPFTNTALPMGEPRRGDIVVFRYPPDVSQFYVKRIVALGGDRVQFRDGGVAVNGEPLRLTDLGWSDHPADVGQRLVREASDGRERTIKLNPFVLGRLPMNIGAPHCRSERSGAWDCMVPAGHLLALGDNRDNSEDSRAWGFVPEREVYGRVDRVIVNYREGSRFWHKPS
ncbi:signal peptidase I [Aquabacterium humicola]|uniref:signal peptidase I n=1 Tax=Aquabacterium humicola TaxID=3237377 RepID=UPI00254394CC|nr:signal peptidase I [Rubrivivax pictus]